MILAHDLEGSGPLLVLIHGITESRFSWDPVSLTDAFTVLRVDLRGHGASESAGPYDLATLAADVHETVEIVAPGAVPLVVGHSMGGIVATAYGSAFPARGIVNVDQPLALGGMQAQVKGAEEMLRGEAFPLFVAGMFGQMYGGLDAGEVARLEGIRSPSQAAVLGMWSPLLDLSPEALDGLVGEITSLPRELPYLVITGLDLGADYLQWLSAAIPQSVQEIWEPATHYPHLADPTRFAARIRAFAAAS